MEFELGERTMEAAHPESELPQPTSTPMRRPLLLVELTGYRILILVLTTGFGTSKAILALKGQSVAPNSLDLTFGVFVTIGLWWVGLYENIDPPIAPWFFHVDYSHQWVATIRNGLAGTMWLAMTCSALAFGLSHRLTRVIRLVVRGTFALTIMFLTICMIIAAPTASVFTSSIFLRCILFIAAFILMIIMFGVETSYAWLRKPNELVHEFYDSLTDSELYYGFAVYLLGLALYIVFISL